MRGIGVARASTTIPGFGNASHWAYLSGDGLRLELGDHALTLRRDACGNARPRVTITAPADGSSPVFGRFVNLAGQVEDEDAQIPRDRMLFTSDRDGAIAGNALACPAGRAGAPSSRRHPERRGGFLGRGEHLLPGDAPGHRQRRADLREEHRDPRARRPDPLIRADDGPAADLVGVMLGRSRAAAGRRSRSHAEIGDRGHADRGPGDVYNRAP